MAGATQVEVCSKQIDSHDKLKTLATSQFEFRSIQIKSHDQPERLSCHVAYNRGRVYI